MDKKKLGQMLACAALLNIAPCAYAGDVPVQIGKTTLLKIDPANNGAIDYADAKPMELPMAPLSVDDQAMADLVSGLSGGSVQPPGLPGVQSGNSGTGITSPVRLLPASRIVESPSPEEFGSTNLPFSTARADGLTGTTNTIYPYRASGKLFFQKSGSSSSFVCSASLIKPGVIVTAAHCVAGFGTKKFHSNWRFMAGYRNGVAPFGVQTARTAVVLSAYLNGTDSCAQAGVVCKDDVAVIVLSSNVGSAAGYYGIGWDGFGFTGNGLTEITQIGYPVCLDSGQLMERNNAQGFRTPSLSNNTVAGSLMCGGSSGGPWLINFGVRPTLTGTTPGSASSPNVVVGVTSWGYTNSSFKKMGASPFTGGTSGNIVSLLKTACTAFPGSC